MQGKKLLLAAAMSGTLLCAIPAWADMSMPDGWYLDGNIGGSRQSDKSYPGPSSSSSSGLGGSVDVGYKFMPYFGAEIGYSLYANTIVKDQFGTKAATDKHYSYDLAGKGILPLGPSGAEAFAKLGIGRLKSSVRVNNATAANNIGISNNQHSDTALYMALGGQYYFYPSLAAVAQWARQQGNSNTGDMDLYTIGVSWIIG